VNEYVIRVTPTRHPEEAVEIAVDADSITESLRMAIEWREAEANFLVAEGDDGNTLIAGVLYGPDGYEAEEDDEQEESGA
jgi:hypothetical protein